MDIVHGKPIDVSRLKKPVLTGLEDHLKKIVSITNYLAESEDPMEQTTCYVCGSLDATPFAEIHGFTYVKCSQCSHVYTSYRYTEEAIKRFYRQNLYWAEVTYANRETCFYRREHVARPKVEFVEKYLDGDKGIWIDVGSGIGDLVSVLTEKGWQAIGLEISETSVRFAQEVFHVSLVPHTFEDFCGAHPEMIGAVDVISFIGLIEHVVNPMQHLALARQMLKQGGVVMIQVPSANSVASMIQAVFPDNVFRHMSPVEHIMLFTKRSLITAVELAGFEPLALWFHGLDIYELLNNLILVNDRVQDSELYRTIHDNMNELQLVFDKQKLSDRIICVAKKRNSSSINES